VLPPRTDKSRAAHRQRTLLIITVLRSEHAIAVGVVCDGAKVVVGVITVVLGKDPITVFIYSWRIGAARQEEDHKKRRAQGVA
jgi:hypothetical protein